MFAWLLTNTTYGTWLPGDPRGSVIRVRDEIAGGGRALTLPASEPLRRSARRLMKGAPIYLTRPQAETVLAQFLETAEHRGWKMLAASIMANHYHLVIAASEDWPADRMLADLKAYGTRALSAAYGAPASGTWWTAKGSKRRLADDRAVASAVNYVLRKQPFPLVIWCREKGRLV